mmetsp:Transcript_31445/g.81311  ORF Transcript_31445/g.81311 Transcript_31445/m.81311 type:complete len:764 (+) Transcript_31445:159-2450(+)
MAATAAAERGSLRHPTTGFSPRGIPSISCCARFSLWSQPGSRRLHGFPAAPRRSRRASLVSAVATPVKERNTKNPSDGAASAPNADSPAPALQSEGQGWSSHFSSVVNAPQAVVGVLWHLVDRTWWSRDPTDQAEAEEQEVHPAASVELDEGEPGLLRPLEPPCAVKEQVASAASAEAKQEAEKAVMDISSYLATSGTLETRYLRMLSSLCALTYVMDRLTPRNLYRMHRLELVTSSRACELPASVSTSSRTRNSVELGDCMAAAPVTASCAAEWDEAAEKGAASDARDTSLPSQLTSLQGSLSNIAPLTRGALGSRRVVWQSGKADIVAWKLGEAAAAAAAAAFGGQAVTTARRPFSAGVAVQLEAAAARGGHGAEVVEAAAAAKGIQEKAGGSCPCEWFVCDDPVSHTRYFVIQGSDSLGSWVTNVTFDPTVFEHPELGVKAALALYGRFLPLIEEHLAGSPFATVTFTGHSLGGALATALLLMYTARGVLSRSTISPVYTFGSAAVFCETGGVQLGPAPGEPEWHEGGEATQDMLAKLGLPEGSVRNVVMHRDIVPRAFACDYSLVAPILRRFAPFGDHRALGLGRGVLYSFVGRMMVLQPGADLRFMHEGYHPMLPPGAGLYTMRDPTLAGERPPGAQCASTHSASLGRAVMAFMDNPHPLDILADRRAYGHDGQISRYHNPDNYTRALGGVLRSRRSLWAGFLDASALQRRAVAFVERSGAALANVAVLAPLKQPLQHRRTRSIKSTLKAPPSTSKGH